MANISKYSVGQNDIPQGSEKRLENPNEFWVKTMFKWSLIKNAPLLYIKHQKGPDWSAS